MGVPGLFGYCLKKFGNQIVIKKLSSKIHYLFIDGNGFIYRAVELVIKENEKLEFTPNQFYNLIYEKTLILLEETVEEVQPEILYLTFDGVAPLAKINQQRSRRYKTKYEDDFRSYLDEKYKKPKKPFESNFLIIDLKICSSALFVGASMQTFLSVCRYFKRHSNITTCVLPDPGGPQI